MTGTKTSGLATSAKEPETAPKPFPDPNQWSADHADLVDHIYAGHPGSQFVYFRGDLACACGRGDVDALALRKTTKRAVQDGKILVARARVSEGIFDYIAIKAKASEAKKGR